MNKKDILRVAEAVANEKGVEKDIIFNALECALASATRKRYEVDTDIRVSIDPKTGECETFRRWLVVADDEMHYPSTQTTISAAQQGQPDIQIGDYVEEMIESVDYNRIGAQTAKQVIVQKIREAERGQIVEAYQERQGELVSGLIKRIDRGNVIVDMGNNAEAFIPREDMIPREAVRPGDRIRGYLKSVRPEQRGPQLFLSRTAPEFLIKLFTLEVPEIGEGLIDVVDAARDPGSRAKISVRGRDPRIDPVGACVGMRGSRVQVISNELSSERVDIILWDENPAQYVINAMSPAEVVSIIMDEDSHSMDVAVREEQLSQAIGRNGQNVKLASQLTGWTLNVMTESQAEEKNEEEVHTLLELFMARLDVDKDIASILVEEGFSSLEEVAYVPMNEMLEIGDFDEDIVRELRNRAKDSLLNQAIADEEQQGDGQPTADLLGMEGMDEALAEQLAQSGILSMDDLAEQSIDDLMEIDGMDEAKAGQLIMKAREPWFAGENQASGHSG